MIIDKEDLGPKIIKLTVGKNHIFYNSLLSDEEIKALEYRRKTFDNLLETLPGETMVDEFYALWNKIAPEPTLYLDRKEGDS